MNTRKIEPLEVVSTVPVWMDSGYEKSSGWVVRVNFPGIKVPNFRGATIHEHCSIVAPEEYAKKYAFITWVEYLFKDSLFRDGYKKMCNFQNKMLKIIKENYIQSMKNNKIVPIETQHNGFIEYNHDIQSLWFWRMIVDFRGDITGVFKQHVAKECGLLPRGAEIREFKYNPDDNVTSVIYEFSEKESGHGRSIKRANRFDKRLKLQKQQITRKQERDSVVLPIFVSETPKARANGYKVYVKFEGDFANYFPCLRNRFEYDPIGAKITKSIYDQTNNVTTIEYLFRCGVKDRGAIRSWDFIEKMRAQINSEKQNENIR